MTTITAVELRRNLESILKRVMAGEDIRVTYRHQPAVKLTSDLDKKSRIQRMHGLDVLDAAKRKGYKFDETKSYKELYHEHLERKYGEHAR